MAFEAGLLWGRGAGVTPERCPHGARSCKQGWFVGWNKQMYPRTAKGTAPLPRYQRWDRRSRKWLESAVGRPRGC